MDPLTHTLVGANLAATRLGKTTRLAAAALVAGANLPDVDAILYFTGHEDLALGFRRGWTHGLLALIVLPFLLTGLLMLWARWRPPRGDAPPLRPGWLLALSALAILTHPTLDWLNNYGMRWLMPFSGRWSYGDSVFIMDPWLWLILGCGWLAGRRPTRALVIASVVVAALLIWVVFARAPGYIGVVVVVVMLLFAALLWRSPREWSTAAVILSGLYILARLTIHGAAVAAVREELPAARRVMVSPHPINPARWEVVLEQGDYYRYGNYSWAAGLRLAGDSIPIPKPSPEWFAASRHPSVRGFMIWVRFPWYEVERSGGSTRVFIRDARYAPRRTRAGFGGVEVTLPPGTP